MKAVFRANSHKGGFISASIAPTNHVHEPRFCFLDGVIVVALVTGVLLLMRLVLA